MNMWPFGKKQSPVVKRHKPAPISFRSFYAGALDRLTNSFKGTDLSINESLKADLAKMKQRSRQLLNDNDYAKKYINMVKTNVVGSKGIRLQARAKGNDGLPDKTDNDGIEKAWKDFGTIENCAVNGHLSLLDMQNVSIAAVATDGESLIRIVKGKSYKYGVALQLIDTDRLDPQVNREAKDGLNRIVMGIEVDGFEVPVAYYILVEHPSETVYTFGGKRYDRIPASEIIHLFRSERVGQARGIPWMHTSIRRLNMVGGYEEAELVAARAGAAKMGFITTETGTEYTGDDTDADGNIIEEVEPGVIRQLPVNAKFESYDPNHPTGAFNYFLRGVLRGAAAGLNVAYTSFSGDLEAVNYSSIRAGLIEERENWRSIQGWYSQHFMQRVYKAWLSAALTRGLIINDKGVRLPLSKKDKFLEVSWQPRGWAWVDPLKDQQANDAAIAAGHTTNTAVAAAQGNDIEEIYETLKWEKELAQKYGLNFTATTEGKNDDDEEDDTKTNKESGTA